jgi:hypothetical protein
MDRFYWTVCKIRDALECFALVHQHAIFDSCRILHEHQKLIFMVRDTHTSEPKEVVWGPEGMIIMRGPDHE